MSRWEELFAKVADLPSGQDLVSRREEEAARRLEFEQWVFAIAPQVISDLQKEMVRRGAELSERTNAAVVVTGPDPDKAINPKAPWLTYLTLSLGNTLLYVYASRGGGSRLSLHMVPDDASWARKNRRVISNAGCFVVRQGNSLGVDSLGAGYELRYLRGDPDGGPKDVMPLGTMVYRAFELLVNAHVQSMAGHSRL